MPLRNQFFKTVKPKDQQKQRKARPRRPKAHSNETYLSNNDVTIIPEVKKSVARSKNWIKIHETLQSKSMFIRAVNERNDKDEWKRPEFPAGREGGDNGGINGAVLWKGLVEKYRRNIRRRNMVSQQENSIASNPKSEENYVIAETSKSTDSFRYSRNNATGSDFEVTKSDNLTMRGNGDIGRKNRNLCDDATDGIHRRKLDRRYNHSYLQHHRPSMAAAGDGERKLMIMRTGSGSNHPEEASKYIEKLNVNDNSGLKSNFKANIKTRGWEID